MALPPDPPYAVVVDDDPRSREILGDALYRHGLVPLLVSSGAEAMQLMAGASAPVLIVLAWKRLDVAPAELLARLRGDARWARARVLLTSSVPGARVPDGVEVDGVIQKPLNGDSLLRMLANPM